MRSRTRRARLATLAAPTSQCCAPTASVLSLYERVRARREAEAAACKVERWTAWTPWPSVAGDGSGGGRAAVDLTW